MEVKMKKILINYAVLVSFLWMWLWIARISMFFVDNKNVENFLDNFLLWGFPAFLGAGFVFIYYLIVNIDNAQPINVLTNDTSYFDTSFFSTSPFGRPRCTLTPLRSVRDEYNSD